MNGTTTLFAALNTANGEVYGLCQQKHRHREWLKFLRMIDRTVPGGKDIQPHLTLAGAALFCFGYLAVIVFILKSTRYICLHVGLS